MGRRPANAPVIWFVVGQLLSLLDSDGKAFGGGSSGFKDRRGKGGAKTGGSGSGGGSGSFRRGLRAGSGGVTNGGGTVPSDAKASPFDAYKGPPTMDEHLQDWLLAFNAVRYGVAGTAGRTGGSEADM
ncbi:hypothetical protein JCM3774_003531 [Rhodotorula dairenensis]